MGRAAWIGLGVTAALCAAAVFGYERWVVYEHFGWNTHSSNQALAVRHGTLRSLAGLTLGQSYEEVIYAWGPPTTSLDHALAWESGDALRIVNLSKSNRVFRISCGHNETYDGIAPTCDRLAEVTVGGSEDEANAAFGEPSGRPSFSGVRKTVVYGNDPRLTVVFNRGAVERFILQSTDGS